MQIQPPAPEVVIPITQPGRKQPVMLRLASADDCDRLITAVVAAKVMLTSAEAANPFTNPFAEPVPAADRGEHPYPEPCRVTRTNGAGTTEFCTRDAGHDGPHRDGPCAEWTTAIIVENGDAPADLVADTTAEMDHCQAYAENPRGIDQLLCWRPGGHDGPHYDKVDQLAWTISGADEPEPDDTVSDRVVVEAETGTMLAGPMTPGTAMQWVNLKRAAWGVPMKIEHLTREPVHSRQCGDFHQEYSGCTRTADHAAVHAHITSDGTVAGIWPRPAATVNPAVAGTPVPGRDGYVTGTCGHPMASQEWESGWSLCEQCDPGERLVTAPATPEASRM